MMRERLTDVWRGNEKLRYLVVGGWNSAVGWGLFFLLYALLKQRLNYLVIAVLAHLIAITNSFVCHRLFVFRSRAPLLSSYLRFHVTQLLALGWGVAGLAVFVQLVHLSPPIAQCIVVAMGLVITYVLHRRFSFGQGLTADELAAVETPANPTGEDRV